jgi:hypothetical protein
VKILLLLLLLVAVAVGVYFSATNNEESAVELNEEVTEPPLLQDETNAFSVTQPEVKDVLDNKAIAQLPDENKSALAESSEETRQRKDIEGVFDSNAIAPEDESVQHVYDDAMVISVSNGPAPEAGSEMMPDGGGNPMYAESIEGANASESMDEHNN